MERRKYRIGSILLAIILLGNLVLLMPFASSEELVQPLALLDTETTYAQYLADYYVSRSSLTYHLYENKMPYHDYTSDVASDMEKAVNTWRAVTMDLGDHANYSDKEVEFYILLVFDVAYQITNEKSVLENANTGAKAIQASTLLELGKMSAESAMEITADMEVTQENWTQVFNQIITCKAMTKVAGYGDKILKSVKYVGNVEELLEKLYMINDFIACSDILSEILDDMYATATDPVLKEALREMSLMATGLLSDAEIVTIFGGNIALQDMADYALGQLWDELAKKLPILQSISLGQGMGKLACNLLFSTDAVVENWYSMHKVAIFENDLRKCLQTYVSNYKSSPTHENALILNKAVEVFYGTMSTGMEYAYKFAEASKGGGVFGWFYKTFNSVKYEKTLNSLASIKKIIDTDMYFANNHTYNLYLELMEESTSATGEYMPVWEPTPCTVTEQELDEQQIVVVETLYKMNDHVVSSNSSLTADKETYGKFTVTGGTLSLNEYTLTVGEDYYITGGTVNVGTGKLVIDGDLYIQGGTLQLQEGSVTVAGNVYHSNGLLDTMRGSLEVTGDYRLAAKTVNEYGEIAWGASNGYLKMTESDAAVTVGGMFYTNSEKNHNSCLTAGTMYIAGDFYQYHSGAYQSELNFKTTGTHKVVMNGTAVQNVYLQSNHAIFTVLEIANEVGISSGGYFAATSLTSSLETARIQSADMMLRVLTVDAPYVEITGDVTKVADTLSLGSNKMKIDGNLIQSGGMVDTKRGALEVTGDYRIATKTVNEYGEISWGASDGYLKMTESDVAVTVGGMFYTNSEKNHNSYLTAGTMYIAGDFYQYHSGAYQSELNFKTTGTHKVVMNGTAVQSVYLQSNHAIFTVLEIANEVGISSGGYFAATSLVSSLETARIQSADMMLRVLTVDAPYVEITGDVTKVADTLSLGSNKMKIDGNLIQSGGMVDTKRGALEVTGDYRIATKTVNEYGEISWGASDGYLKMTESDAAVTVGGMFYTNSEKNHNSCLTAGTMYIAGDFYQYNNSASQSSLNFKTSGSHTVYLNGTKAQNIYFQSSNSKFTILHPTQSLDRYTFSPAVCWTTLHGTTTSQVIAPDCDTPGCTLHTCTLCGGTYEEEPVDMLGHDYLNGFCSVCGAADPDYVAPVTVTGKSFSLSFEDEILVNFYYTVSDETDVTEHGMLVFYSDPGTVDITNAEAVYNEPVHDSAKDRYMATTTGIAAKEMGDTRYYVAYAKLSNGTYVYSTMYDYSPKKYAMNMLGKTTSSDKQKTLCVAMLNYGAAAQVYFGYNTDNLMNSELTADQQALVVAYDASLFTGALAADSSKTGSFAATSTGFSKKSATVSFEGAFCVNYYFTPNCAVSGDMILYIWNPENYAAATTLTAANASETMTMVAGSDGRYWGQVSGIAAKSLDETYYVAGVYTDADGNTCCTGVIAYSLSKYCMNNAVPGKDMQELAAAAAMYGYYAKAYFG